jgi:predicted flap endonuclease-1-like 5' DNA nuclease
MTLLSAIVLIILVAGAALGGYAFAMRSRARGAAAAPESVARPVPAIATTKTTVIAGDGTEMERVGIEKARIIRSLDAEAAALRANPQAHDASAEQGAASGEASGGLEAKLADALRESARYRQLVVDIENNAPPPILSGAGEPDDLKLIVGIGPVLERMLHNLGVTTFRQVARWSERDSAEFDAKLPEFPGRIVRDQWVTQARELHQAKFGELPSDRPPRT